MKKTAIVLMLAAAAAGVILTRTKPAPLAVGQQAPALRLPGLSGRTVALTDYRGKVVLLNFWATWCQTCTTEMPELERLYQKHRAQGFELLAPSVDVQGRVAVMPFVAQFSPSFTILLADPRASQAYRVRGLPSAFLIDADGTLLRHYVGGVATRVLENDILKALEKRRQS